MNIAIIGAGNMGGAVARGLAAADGYNVTVSNPSVAKLDAITRDFPNVTATTSNIECAGKADVIILAVKPWKIEAIVKELRHLWEKKNIAIQAARNNGCPLCLSGSKGLTIISLAAGLTLSDLRGITGEYPDLYRVIPNTAASIGESMTFISADRPSEDLDAMVCEIFNNIGSSEIVEERMLDAGMAVASCGMAFMMRMLRAMTEGGVELGLYPATALRAAAATMRGAADLIERNGLNPEEEVDRVTTPGGITIRGLNAMEEAGFTGAVVKGLRACSTKK